MCFFIPIVLFSLLAYAWARGAIESGTFVLLSALIWIPDLVLIAVYIFTEVICVGLLLLLCFLCLMFVCSAFLLVRLVIELWPLWLIIFLAGIMLYIIH